MVGEDFGLHQLFFPLTPVAQERRGMNHWGIRKTIHHNDQFLVHGSWNSKKSQKLQPAVWMKLQTVHDVRSIRCDMIGTGPRKEHKQVIVSGSPIGNHRERETKRKNPQRRKMGDRIMLCPTYPSHFSLSLAKLP